MHELPTAFDPYPAQDESLTRIHPFFENLRNGRLTTTRCTSCGEVSWPPRVVCPGCMGDSLEWVDLPEEGELHAFSAMMLGAPFTMEKDVPFVAGMVRLSGTDLMIYSRIDDARYEDLSIGDRVRLKVISLPDGRVFYRFVPVR